LTRPDAGREHFGMAATDARGLGAQLSEHDVADPPLRCTQRFFGGLAFGELAVVEATAR